MNRKYSPQLIWAYLCTWADQEFPDRLNVQGQVQVFIYVAGKPGAYYLHGPKLYWDDTVGDGYWGNTDQDGLWEDRDNLCEVVIHGLKQNRELVMFPTYNEFLEAVGFREEK